MSDGSDLKRFGCSVQARKRIVGWPAPSHLETNGRISIPGQRVTTVDRSNDSLIRGRHTAGAQAGVDGGLSITRQRPVAMTAGRKRAAPRRDNVKNKVLHNVFQRLANSFSEPTESGPTEPHVARGRPTRGRPARARASGDMNSKDFNARLSETVRNRLPNTAGKFQVVRLDRISDAFGERWPVIQDRVLQLAERVLQKRLTRVDCYSRGDDKSFLVLFVELTEEQARFKAKSIADEIQGLILGEVDNGPDIGVRTGVAAVERLALSEPVTSEALSLALDDEIAAEATDSEITERSLVGDVDVEYRPTLNVRAGYVAIFDSVPSRRTGTRVYRGQAFYPGGCGELNLRMNLEIICRAMLEVRQAMATGRKFSAVMPIHFHAIGSRYRHELIEVLKTIDQDTRNVLVFDIIGCLPGTPLIRLGEVISALSSFGRAVTMRVNIDYPYIDSLRNLGLMALGTDLNERDIDGSTMNLLTAFVRRVRTIGLHPYVFGIRSADLIAPLAGLGVDYINGPAIAAPSQMIGTLEPYAHPLTQARSTMDLVPASGVNPVKWAATRSTTDTSS